MKVFQIQNQFSACLQMLLEAIQLDQDGKILRQHIIDKLVQGKFLLYALDFSKFHYKVNALEKKEPIVKVIKVWSSRKVASILAST